MNNYNLLKQIKVVYENINDLTNLENLELDDNYSSILENTKNMLSKLYNDIYTIINNNNEKVLKTDSACHYCLDKLKISDLIDYDYVCENCDENFYTFEVNDKNAWYNGKKSVTNYNEINSFLEKGDKVEISSCAITNDVGGTTIIRNSNYKDEVDGMTLTIENSDGTIEHTTIKSHDKLVNLPIEIEVVDSFYDYETGYNYKGRITNDDLTKKFREYGTTGFKPEDYKKYNNKPLYEDALKASKTFNPSIVYFSEFDVIKLIEQNKEEDMELAI